MLPSFKAKRVLGDIMETKKSNILLVVFLVIFVLAIVAVFGCLIYKAIGSIDNGKTNVAIIPVKGIIVSSDPGGLLNDFVVSSQIIEKIEMAEEDPTIDAVLFEINSPGGSAVASDEIGQAIKKLKKANKTTVAWIREVGASGGYWIASNSDHIIANRMSFTGSIGVIASYLDFSGFIEKHDVTYQRMVAGEHKDMGSPFKELSKEEENIFQEQLNQIHEYFIAEVAENRKLTEEQVKEFADGSGILGIKAFKLGLVDELGGKDEAEAYFNEKFGEEINFIYYSDPSSFFDIFSGVISKHGFNVGNGIGKALVSQQDSLIQT
jgi:protease IV